MPNRQGWTTQVGRVMLRLTERDYWDAKYGPSRPLQDGPTPQPGALITAIKWLFGPRGVEYTRDYPDYLVWDVLYMKHLPRTKGARVLEVGSAPGEHLVNLWRAFDYE